jgi:cytoskeletal protein CcmA (bactofilin family)
MKDIETGINAEIIQQSYRTDYTSANTDCLCSGRGDLWFKGNLRVDGIFSGKLNVCGSLTVGKNARITGEIMVNDLILHGYVVGSVKVNNMAVFHSSSMFSGTLIASEAEFHTGSRISGKRTIGRTTEIDAIITSKNSIYNLDDPAFIPDEMTHSKLQF